METQEMERTEDALTGGTEQKFSISADLIRGHINTIILRSLYDGDKYGYDIINEIEKKSGGLYTIKQPTLYSALTRLESLTYVESYYGDFSNGGRRKYFRLTELGKKITEQNLSEWEYSRTIIDSLISDGDKHYDFSFITDKQQELASMKKTLLAREQALEEERSALKNLQNEVQRERSLLSVQSSSLNTQKEDFNELKEKIDAQKLQLEEKELLLSEKQGEIQAKESIVNDKQTEIDEANRQIENQKEKIESLNSTISQLQDSLNTQNQEKDEEQENKRLALETEITNFEKEKEELEILRQDLEKKQTSLSNLQNQLLSEQNNLAAEEEERSKKLNELTQKEQELSEQKKEFEKNKEDFSVLNEQTEIHKAALEEAEKQFAERQAELDKKNYELEEKTYLLDDREKNLKEQSEKNEQSIKELEKEKEDLASQIAARLSGDETIKTREDDLRRGQNDLASRLELYNRQQLDFMTKKNALSADRFEFADKTASFNAQLRAFNDAVNKFSADKNAVAEDKKALETERASFILLKKEFDDKTSDFEKQKAESGKANIEKDKMITSLTEELTERKKLLDDREQELSLREQELSKETQSLNNARREFNEKKLSDQTVSASPAFFDSSARRQPFSYGESYEKSIYTQAENSAPQAISADNSSLSTDFASLKERANAEGIRIRTSGKNATTVNSGEEKQFGGIFNKGLALFKAALVIFAIVLAESLTLYFLKDKLKISEIYPAVGCGCGFLLFIICTVLYSTGYKANARKTKNTGHILSAAILFVISVLIVSMIAVYLKADLKQPTDLIVYVLCPIAYLINILFFSLFYHLFSSVKKR